MVMFDPLEPKVLKLPAQVRETGPVCKRRFVSRTAMQKTENVAVTLCRNGVNWGEFGCTFHWPARVPKVLISISHRGIGDTDKAVCLLPVIAQLAQPLEIVLLSYAYESRADSFVQRQGFGKINLLESSIVAASNLGTSQKGLLTVDVRCTFCHVIEAYSSNLPHSNPRHTL